MGEEHGSKIDRAGVIKNGFKRDFDQWWDERGGGRRIKEGEEHEIKDVGGGVVGLKKKFVFYSIYA